MNKNKALLDDFVHFGQGLKVLEVAREVNPLVSFCWVVKVTMAD